MLTYREHARRSPTEKQLHRTDIGVIRKRASLLNTPSVFQEWPPDTFTSHSLSATSTVRATYEGNMADQDESKTAKVPLKQFLADFRSSAADHELRSKYKLSPRGFVSLIKALLDKQVITPADLAKRKELQAQRQHQLESQFLSTLYLCPACNHPHPLPFEVCPACGADVHEYRADTETLDGLTTIGGTFSVEDIEEEMQPRRRRTEGSKKSPPSSPDSKPAQGKPSDSQVDKSSPDKKK